MPVSNRQIKSVLVAIETRTEKLREYLELLQEEFDELTERQQNSASGDKLQSRLSSLETIIANLEYCTSDDYESSL